MAGIGRKLALAAAVGTMAAAAQGCVSYDMYDQKVREAEANKAAYLGADAAVANARKGTEDMKVRIAALERENATLKSQMQQKDLVVSASMESLKQKYEKMIEDLSAQEGGDWVINKDTGGVVLEENVYFSAGKAELKSERFAALDSLIGKLQGTDFSKYTIEVAGHTDSDPISKSGWKDNFQLSAERARAVLVYFQKKGIPAERLFISGYGPTRPRGTGKKGDDRRVEIVLHERP